MEDSPQNFPSPRDQLSSEHPTSYSTSKEVLTPEGTIDGDAESLLPELTLLVERIEAAADSVDADTQTVTEAKAEVLQAKADTLQAKADTLTARGDALQAKADAITAKESAEASAQAAAEASERAEELIGSVSTKADAIVKNASGEIASFTDGGDDLPMKSLKVNIVPKQSGSGDPSPSNIRPISGTDTVGVTRAGKNLLKTYGREVGTPNPSSGGADTSPRALDTDKYYVGLRSDNYYYPSYVVDYTITENQLSVSVGDNNSYGIAFPIQVREGEVLTFNANATNPIVSFGYYGENWEYVGGSFAYSTLPCSITVPSGVKYITVVLRGTRNGTSTYSDIQLELGSTATEYEPYEGESKSISLGQTVYGGVLDVMSGKLVIDKAMVDLGTRDWASRSAADRHIFRSLVNGLNPAIARPPNGQIPTTAICEQYKAMGYGPISASDNYKFAIGVAQDPLLVIINFDYSTAEDFKTAMNGVKLVYPLATPIEVTLTPTEVKTLLGNNNIWSDSGTVEVEYRADTTLVYNELLALILENIGN